MRIFISEADRQNARRIALINIARFFNISDWDTKSSDELFNDISALNNNDESATNIIRLLNDYFTAYDKWFHFYEKHKIEEDKTGSEHAFSEQEQQELSELIQNRQNTLDALQQNFDDLQIRRFNREHFGNELSGITINR